jgi:hypothetical protein
VCGCPLAERSPHISLVSATTCSAAPWCSSAAGRVKDLAGAFGTRSISWLARTPRGVKNRQARSRKSLRRRQEAMKYMPRKGPGPEAPCQFADLVYGIADGQVNCVSQASCGTAKKHTSSQSIVYTARRRTRKPRRVWTPVQTLKRAAVRQVPAVAPRSEYAGQARRDVPGCRSEVKPAGPPRCECAGWCICDPPSVAKKTIGTRAS